jgi:5-methylcytosine-specific restriction endonuclease McrA
VNFVNLDSLRLPDGWCPRADAKRQQILEAADDPEKRAAALGRSSSVWADAKPALSDLSLGKCWYCEIVESRSDLNVDHFRPKSRVAENIDHDGYWWLAVDPDNFRLSCQFCNQRRLAVDGGEGGGKWDHFPLLDETCRAMSPADDIRNEHVVLIDPTQAIDVSLLSFDYDGKAFPNPQKCPPGSNELTRAETSVEPLTSERS